MTTYRTGGHWGRTIVRVGTQPPDIEHGISHRPDDELVGVMDDPALAERIVALLNADEAMQEAVARMASMPGPRRRLRSCVERWPGAEIEGDYDPRCCRFPKSCSASVWHEEGTTEADLEPL